MSEFKILILEDGLTSYRLLVSNDDYDRAQNDMEFAHSLLFHAQCSNSVQVNEKEEISGNEIINVEEPLVPVDSGSNKNSWSYNETIALINSVSTHIEELNHPRKRKTMFENIANDMISSGHSVNAQQVHLKWKSLLRSYKACKDNKSKTGRSPSRFHFFDQIDAIVGDKPSNSCEHTLESSEEATITATNSEQLSQMVSSDEGNSSKDLQAKKSRKRKRNSQAADLKELIEMKREEYKKRQERFDRKCIIEEKKIELLNKLISEGHS